VHRSVPSINESVTRSYQVKRHLATFIFSQGFAPYLFNAENATASFTLSKIRKLFTTSPVEIPVTDYACFLEINTFLLGVF